MRIIDADSIDYDDYWYNKGFTAIECQKAQQLINEQPTVQAIPIPDNVTNGSVMTAIFSDCKFSIERENWVYIELNGRNYSFCPVKFWDAPYKRGDENE